jgi:CheY-like chemotaxis protein
MRQEPETREISVIAVTAHTLVGEQQRNTECGLPSVPRETDRLSAATSGARPLAARPKNPQVDS